MELDKIGGMTQGDLRRFIVNLMHSDPGALPKKAPNTAQQFPSSPVDGDVPVWDRASQAWVPSTAHPVDGTAFNWHVGTSPPSGPTTGMLWIYTGTGFYWLFVYDNSETTYKWKFIGGPALSAEVTTDEALTGVSSTWYDPATPGPSVTIPRSGDYQVSWVADMLHARNLAWALVVGPAIGASNPVVTEEATSWDGPYNAADGSSTVGVNNSGMRALTGLTATTVLKLKYRAFWGDGLTHPFNVRNRVIEVIPIRVS